MELKNLNYLASIIEDAKRGCRLSNKATLVTLDSKVMAIKTAKMLEHVEQADMTSWCGKLGKRILQGFEQAPIKDPYNHFEKKLRRLRIHVGFWIFRALENEGILSRYRLDDGKHQWTVVQTDKGEKIVDMILQEVPVGERKVTGEPAKWRPLERIHFNDPIAGPLVSKYDVDDIQHWSPLAIPKVYDVINKLQQIPYEVNRDVLEVAQELKKEMKLWSIKKKGADSDEVVGLDRDENMTLYYADALKYDDFYYYWNCDFRGRKYVMSTWLSPQGSKLSKSLIKQVNKERIGNEGWFWMGVHTANVAGHDKLPLDKRYDWFEDNISMMLEIANNPLNDRRWLEMDSPFEFLACCFEVRDAYKLDSVYDHVSGLMIGFDATCSGLQILSLLSRDKITGKLVNLIPNDEIGDSYLHIADALWSELPDDNYWTQHFDDRRSIVKRSVMVKYYKCGKNKMGEHIYSDEKHKRDNLTQELANELGVKIFNKCDELLPGPKKVMDKLTEVGMYDLGCRLGEDGKTWEVDDDLETKDFKYQLPIDGFTIIQRYRVDRTEQMRLKSGDKTIKARYIAEPGKFLNKGKVMTGTAVNIIHGLDSQIPSWLTLNSDYEITPVHDCFSTIPSQASKLFEDTRMALVSIGQTKVTDILEDRDLEDIEYGQLTVEDLVHNEYCMS